MDAKVITHNTNYSSIAKMKVSVCSGCAKEMFYDLLSGMGDVYQGDKESMEQEVDWKKLSNQHPNQFIDLFENTIEFSDEDEDAYKQIEWLLENKYLTKDDLNNDYFRLLSISIFFDEIDDC